METQNPHEFYHNLCQLVTEAYGYVPPNREFTCNVSRRRDGICILSLDKPKSITDLRAKGTWGVYFLKKITLYDGQEEKTNLLVLGSLKQTATMPLLICTPIGIKQLELLKSLSTRNADESLIINKSEIDGNAAEMNAESQITLKIRFTMLLATDEPPRDYNRARGERR